MNTLIADNLDLEVWEGWVGDTHSVAATWHRASLKAHCGFQLFSTWNGCFTLMLLQEGTWSTPVDKTRDPLKVRQAMIRYMSQQIEALNRTGLYTDLLADSFTQAHRQVNQWLNEQAKMSDWFNQYK